MIDRSARREIRNPILALPAARALDSLPGPARAALEQILREIQIDARLRAEKAWRTHKAPMALYWKAVSVYSGHIARAIARSAETIDRIAA